MARPAAMTLPKQATTETNREPQLRVVETEKSKKSDREQRAQLRNVPEVDDELDELWDNVPI